MSTFRKTALSTLAVVLVAAFAMLQMVFERNDAKAQAQAKGEPSSGAVRVEVVEPQTRPLEHVLSIPGSLEPGEVAQVFAKTSGYVASIRVNIGDRVKKEDILLQIDVPEMEDELREAEAILSAKTANVRALRAKAIQADAMIATARAETKRKEAELALGRITVDRKEQLFNEKAIPQQDLDEAKSRFSVLQAEVEIAAAAVRSAEAQKAAVEADVVVAEAQVAVEKARVDRLRTLMTYATVRAPFDGLVTERFVDSGAFVRSAAEGETRPLLTIARVDFVRLVLYVPETSAADVRVGTEIEALCASLGEEPLKVTVSRAAMALEENTRTMRVEADIDNQDGRLMPGLYARTSVLLRSQAQALMIPSKAVRVRGSEVTVLVADGSVARARPIELGVDDGIWAEITKGLAGDERIIVSASGAVAPGAPIVAVSSGS